MDNPLLRVENLALEFHTRKQNVCALKNISYRVNCNETVIVAGESGAGKSLSAQAITRLLPSNAHIVNGNIFFKDIDMRLCSFETLRKLRTNKISYIFQEPASYLNPVICIGDQIAESVMLGCQCLKKQAMLKAEYLLEQVHLRDVLRIARSYPHQLSGGMSQRVAIAHALAADPELIIADEPTTSLDVISESQVIDVLMELKQIKKFSLLFITHNFGLARRIGERMYILADGKTIEEGNIVEVFKSPQTEYGKQLISSYKSLAKVMV